MRAHAILLVVMWLGCGGNERAEKNDSGTHGGTESLLEENTPSGADTASDGRASELVPDVDNDGFNAEADCDDADANVNPDAEEIPYDGIDNDCENGDLVDVDADGEVGTAVDGGTDCDDTNAAVGSFAEEIPYDGIDNDCAGGDIVDVDGDGFHGIEAEGGTDCDDVDVWVYPGAEEIPYDGVDNDCLEGDLVDVDGDGFPSDVVDGGTDCDDGDMLVHPEGVETPYDGIDQDCDGADLVDVDGDGFDGIDSPTGTDCDDLDGLTHPGALELDDDTDNDCDGVIDEDFIAVGDVVISEVMADPGRVGYDGEWFELHNASDRPINLMGWNVRDDARDHLVIGDSVVINPRAYLVFGTGAYPGVVFDHTYASFRMRLSNRDDEITLDVEGRVVGSIVYERSSTGQALGFGGTDMRDASDFSQWCEQRGSDGESHTAGRPNSMCPLP